MTDQSEQGFQNLSDFYESTPRKLYAQKIQYDNPAVFLSFRQHILKGQRAGSFVEAVLRGDFFVVAGRADDRMQHRLIDIATYFQSCAPRGSFGSEEIVSEWRDEGGLVGKYGQKKALELAVEYNL